jgi:hypothetical protein
MENYWSTGRFHPDRDKFTDPSFLQRINFNRPMNEWLRLWDAFARFFRRRRYITRWWILQELTLTCHILMLCSRHEMPWDKMGELCAFLAKIGFDLDPTARIIAKEKFRNTRPP